MISVPVPVSAENSGSGRSLLKANNRSRWIIPFFVIQKTKNVTFYHLGLLGSSNGGGYVRIRINLISSYALTEFYMPVNSDKIIISNDNKQQSKIENDNRADNLALRMITMSQGLIIYTLLLLLEKLEIWGLIAIVFW